MAIKPTLRGYQDRKITRIKVNHVVNQITFAAMLYSYLTYNFDDNKVHIIKNLKINRKSIEEDIRRQYQWYGEAWVDDFVDKFLNGEFDFTIDKVNDDDISKKYFDKIVEIGLKYVPEWFEKFRSNTERYLEEL